MNPVRAFGAFIAIDYMNRTNNYYDMIDRLKGHIIRWTDQIDRLDSAKKRVAGNVYNNRYKLIKAESHFLKLEEESSTGWLKRQRSLSKHHCNAVIREEANRIISEHEERLSNANDSVSELRSWILEGESRLSEIEAKISNVQDKIDSARSKM